MRDKLIELLSENFVDFCHVSMISGNCKISAITFDADKFADFLIANGVTFAPDNNVGKWISTSKRLPTLDDAAEGSVWAILKGERPDMWSYISVQMHPEDFVCWMSIPKPPKERE
jgi:hypothetical protein